MIVRHRDVAALDAKYTGELADAKAENEKLRADVVAGKRQLQLKATCANRTPSTSGVDDESPPDLQQILNSIIGVSEMGSTQSPNN